MKLRIPFYVAGSPKPPNYLVRPLFGAPQDRRWEVQGSVLQKVLIQAQGRCRQHIEESRAAQRLDQLALMSFCPDLKEHFLELKFEFKKRTALCRLLVVSFVALGQRLAFSPSLSEVGQLWFPWPKPGEGPPEFRVGEALRAFLREREREGEEFEPEELSVTGKAWVHYYEIDTPAPGVVVPPRPRSLMALLGAEPTRSGGAELAHTGRNLERVVREQSEAFLGREAELAEMAGWSRQPSRTCLLLVGPRLAGKSALIRAHVRRQLELHDQTRKRTCSQDKRKAKRVPTATWQLAPARLISGMSYLGQWENRLLRILNHCRAKDHLLVFDDLVGLLTAGMSRDSSMNIAQLLKSFLDRGELRVLAESTPEAWQVLRERDRALADHFQVLFVEPTDGPLTRRIALGAARACEESQACQFSLEGVQAAVQLADRYLTDCSHPGKVARLLQQVAAHHRQEEIDRHKVLRWFAGHCGMDSRLLDAQQTLHASDVLEPLREQVVGQEEALQCCVEVVLRCKARTQSPGRPLASLLFIGPTGVGKTECARALARYLFASEERLIRLDMNEFLGFDSVPRLIGTFHRPDGLLTEAVRSQPFSVILLDEIEKAHPHVLQLLLQLLGDGRLTDARGRTADFSQAILVMTSNLGAEAIQQSLGLRSRRQQEELVYRRAAEEFFPPELFNRLDRIVPFRRLDRAAVGQVAERLWRKLLLREGWRRRQCLLEIDPQARELVIDAGFHPQLGARALKRTVEEKVVGPVARRLSALPPDGLTLVQIDSALQVRVERLQKPTTTPLGLHLGELSVRERDRRLQELEEQLQMELAPRRQALYSHEDLNERELLYFQFQEEIRRLRAALTGLAPPIRLPGRPAPRAAPRPRPVKHPAPLLQAHTPEQLERILSSSDLQQQLEQLRQALPLPQAHSSQAQAMEVELRLAWLGTRLRWPQEQTCRLSLSGHEGSRKLLLRLYQEALAWCDGGCQAVEGGLEASGLCLERLLGQETGLHLFCHPQGFHTVWVRLCGRASGSPEASRSEGASRSEEASPVNEAAPVRVVRLYGHKGPFLDFPSGLLSPHANPLPSFWRCAVGEA